MALKPHQPASRLLVEKRVSLALGLMVLAYLLLGVVYSVSLPILEAPDEMWHYAYVRYLVEEHRLPDWDTESSVGQESSQPPLYYATAALATAGIDASSPQQFLDRNPYWGYPSAGRVHDNKNLFFHQRKGAESFPWQGTALVVHVARLVNIVFGAVTVVFAYLLAREVFPGRHGLALSAAAVVAFNPQFLFISSALNNDAATSAFSTAALWLVVRGLRLGYTPRRLVGLGGTVGLASLCKVSALALVPIAVLAIGLRTWVISNRSEETAGGRSREWQHARLSRFILGALLCAVSVVAVSGWWYVRNSALYGDPFGFQTHLATGWAHEEPPSLVEIWTQLPNIETSNWGAFGWGNVHLPQPFYVIVRVAVRLAVVGLLAWAGRAWQAGARPGSRAWSLGLLALWVLVVLAALLRWMQMVEAALGRLLFPAIAAVAVLMTWGLSRLSGYVSRILPEAWGVQSEVRNSVLAAFVGVLLCTAVASPFIAIRPAYAKPSVLSDEEIASRTDPVNIRFGEGIRLVGFDRHPQSASPGEEVSITLCWEALLPIKEKYACFVHFLGPDNAIVGARDTHPGLGRFPTSQWMPGDSFCDVVRVPIAESTEVPAVYDIEIGWYEPESNLRLPAYTADGSKVELVTLGKVEIVPKEQPAAEVPNRVEARLGDQVTLLGYDLVSQGPRVRAGEPVHVTLYWQARSSPAADYTVFLHLANPTSSPYAQDDGQPRDGTYPTSYWDAGQVVTDTHNLVVPADVPPGHYSLLAGMYRLETGERLPAFDTEGKRLPADAVPLVALEVLP